MDDEYEDEEQLVDEDDGEEPIDDDGGEPEEEEPEPEPLPGRRRSPLYMEGFWDGFACKVMRGSSE
jgi:hypothetical protein